MTTLLIVLLSLLPQSAEPWKHQLDLEPMLRDSESLKKLTVMYDSPLQQGFELLFVRGDGSLILQRYPGRPMATTDLPTCTEKIGQDQVKKLASFIASKHFWELPEKRFLFINGEPSHKELEVHRIFISNGTEKAQRVFAVGTYAGKQETIPDDFAMIEQQFKQLAQSAFAGKACHLAPAVQF
jgi:hypothetical protein